MTKTLTEKEVTELVSQHPMTIQFKNALKYIQSGTNMSLERLSIHLDALVAALYLEGYVKGVNEAIGLLDKPKSLPSSLGKFTSSSSVKKGE